MERLLAALPLEQSLQQHSGFVQVIAGAAFGGNAGYACQILCTFSQSALISSSTSNSDFSGRESFTQSM